MSELFLSLSKKQMGRVTSNIEDAALFFHGNGDYQEMLKSFANRSAGKIKEIYNELSELNEDDFNIFVNAMVN